MYFRTTVKRTLHNIFVWNRKAKRTHSFPSYRRSSCTPYVQVPVLTGTSVALVEDRTPPGAVFEFEAARSLLRSIQNHSRGNARQLQTQPHERFRARRTKTTATVDYSYRSKGLDKHSNRKQEVSHDLPPWSLTAFPWITSKKHRLAW